MHAYPTKLKTDHPFCSLLKTVPSDVLDKGKVAADSYRSSLENADVDISDPELKELQSIL